MLYKFKSKATGDLIMLEPNGRRVLGIVGKASGPTGIILAAEMPAAMAALEAAVVQEEQERKVAADEARAQGHAPPEYEGVSLRQRAAPFIDMLRRCAKADVEIVWGV
jgi:Domain of unknown function (DUF1840)